MEQTTIGTYLARRLVELGITDFFAIPGDFNLTLLDELLKQPDLRMVTCCNELNAGYAADGYARARGAAALAVTFAVGALSALNAVAGAYAEDLPVIVVSGGPNVRAVHANRTLHHTLARPGEGETFALQAYRTVTAHAVVVRDAATAPYRIDEALRIALAARKPVYLEIACDLATALVGPPQPRDLRPVRRSDPAALAAAVEHAARFLNDARQPVLVAGSRLRSAGALHPFHLLAGRAGYGVACMANAKGFFPETHRQFMGIYWGNASSAGCREVVEASDAYLFAGPVFSDYTTVGFSTLIRPERLVEATPERILVAGLAYHGIDLAEFLEVLAGRLESNAASLEAYQRIQESCAPGGAAEDGAGPLSTRGLYARLQELLAPETTIVAETGDAWFNGMDLRLPDGCRFEIQMQYGSIGWSVGAFLGLAVADPDRRVLGLIGDGSFQMSAQELSTFLRLRLRGCLVLLNNGAYTIEVMIHDGPYNELQNWNYAAFAEAVKGGAPLLARQVRSVDQLADVLDEGRDFPGLVFIEAMLGRTDVNKALLGWGTAVADYNAGKG